MAEDDVIKLPRLYVDCELTAGGVFTLDRDRAHYLATVMRRASGDRVRLFNGRHGEWLAALEMPDRRTVRAHPVEQIREQVQRGRETHLLFAPLKKNAMDFLVEKAVELGVTHLHPVVTRNTEVRKINESRIRQQILEAAEQCERLDIPVLEPLTELAARLESWPRTVPVLACVERQAALLLKDALSGKNESRAFLVGPEGGFTAEEKAFLKSRSMPVSLGEPVLRAETAALACLVLNGL